MTSGYLTASADDCFAIATEPLKPSSAVAALMVLESGRYVMQLRDSLPNIFYPGHWGCFGGALDKGERAGEALIRELGEELEFVPAQYTEFMNIDFDFTKLGLAKVTRFYYEVPVREDELEKFVLHEGAAFEAVEGRDLLTKYRMTPYDAFAVWSHMNKSRFTWEVHDDNE